MRIVSRFANRTVLGGLLFPLLIMGMMTGCGTAPSAGPNNAPSASITPEMVTPTVADALDTSTNMGSGTGSVAATAIPTFSPTGVPDVITVWWPAALYPVNESVAEGLLLQALDDFRVTHGTTVVIRVKRNEGNGGSLETLRSGSQIAPSVMPDIVLMRRSELVQAAAEKLIFPIDPTTFDAFEANDQFAAALAQGQVNGEQYGVPYALEVDHAVYLSTALTTAPRSLPDLLGNDQAYEFPAGVYKGVSTTLLAQYIAAGGRLVDANGVPIIDTEALTKVLDYYEQAVKAKLAGPQLLDYTNATQYWPILGTGKINAVAVNSTLYLAQRESFTAIEPIAPPMVAGSTVITLDAWQWVVTTTNTNQVNKAINFIAWLTRPEEQSRYMQSIGVVPARKSALAAWQNDKYAAFLMTLLDAPTTPPLDTINPVVATALQTALTDVLSGRKGATAAANDALVFVQQSQ